jgi:hypothetical protein
MQTKVNRIIELLLVVTLCHFSLPASAQNIRRSQSTQYGGLPLTFEANRGQTNAQAKFLVRGRGYTAHLTTDGMVLALRTKQTSKSMSGSSTTGTSNRPNMLEIRLQGANAKSDIVGEQPQPGIVNYFIGRNPANWRTKIPTYARVRYKSVYPGIDLVYHGNHQQLEYDFELQPGSRPEQIAFEIRGANKAAVDANGNLVIKVNGSTLQVQCPVVYQMRQGEREQVKGEYVMKDPTHLGFRVSQYDRTQALVIDPVIAYATYLGGSGTDVAGGMAVDAAGNLYLTGYTDSDDFPSGTSGFPANSNHVFVSKLDASGSNLLYTDYIGGNGEDYGIGLVLDSSNGVFVTGSTTSSNFPVVNGYQQSQPGPYTGFLSHVSHDGSSLLYSTYLGGSTFDYPTSIAINQSGQVYVAGFTMSQNYPTVNALQGSASPNQGGNYGDYGFVTKFSEDGSSLIYSTYLAGSSNVIQTCGSSPCWPQPYSAVSGISLDANDNLYVTGTTNTYNYPTTSGVYQATNTTDGNAYISFVTKLTSAGALGYSTYFYGSGSDSISTNSIAVDGTGSAYVTGTAASDGTFPVTVTSICDPGVSGFDCSYTFATKFDPTGSTLLYSTFLGAFNYATPQAILLDSQANAYILTNTTSPNFQTINPVEGYTSGFDALVVEINADATVQLFSTYLGGSGDEIPSGMALDTQGNVYIAGSTGSSDFPVTQAAFQTQSAGNNDTFLAKIYTGTAPIVSLTTTTLQFASTAVGSQSAASNVQLHNLTAMPLTIASISMLGDFSQNNTCGSTLAAYASCTLSVTFAPTTSGNRTGSLTINDNATGAPHVIGLQGNGTSTANLSNTALTFATTAVGSSSAAQSVTLTNQGISALTISGVQLSGDFSQTNNCPASLSAHSSCTIQVAFAPKSSGSRSGSLRVNDNTASDIITLSGTGSDFALNTSSSTATVSAGSSATYTLQINSAGGTFASTVSLSCGQLPSHATCSLSPSSAKPGTKGTSVTVTIATNGSSSSFAAARSQNATFAYATWIQFQGMGLLGFAMLGARFGRKKWLTAVSLALILLLLCFAVGCAGGTGIAQQDTKNTPAGTYTVSVTGTSGTLKHSVNLTLIVQ